MLRPCSAIAFISWAFSENERKQRHRLINLLAALYTSIVKTRQANRWYHLPACSRSKRGIVPGGGALLEGVGEFRMPCSIQTYSFDEFEQVKQEVSGTVILPITKQVCIL